MAFFTTCPKCGGELNHPGECGREAMSDNQPTASGVSEEMHGLDTAERVCFYEQDFYVLSNFSAFAVEWSGFLFPTAEHLYHWLRFVTSEHQDGLAVATRITRARSAHDAFKAAQENKPLQRSDWDAVKVGTMKMVLKAKVAQHEYVRRKLLATGDRELVENSWRDDFWGWGPNRTGQNMLGKLWMEVRAEIRSGPGEAALSASPPQPIPTPDEAELNAVLMARNPMDWVRPDNIDKHPDRYSPLRDAIEGILLKRIYQKRHDGYTLETSIEIMDTVNIMLAALSRARPEEAIREAALEDVLVDLKKWADAHNSDAKYYNEERGHEWEAHFSRHLHSEMALKAAIKRVEALKSKSAHSPAPRVDEAEMREMYRQTRTKMDSEAAWLRGNSACEEEVALAFGRALLEKKP